MNFAPMFMAALIVLPACALVAWAWLSMAQADEDLRAFSAFDGLKFEIAPPAMHSTEGGLWPLSG